MKFIKKLAGPGMLLGTMFWASGVSAIAISNDFYLENGDGDAYAGYFTTNDIGNDPDRSDVLIADFSLSGPGGILWEEEDFTMPRLTAALNSDQTEVTAINGSGSQLTADGWFTLSLSRVTHSYGGEDYRWMGTLWDSQGLRFELGNQVIPEPGVLALLGVGLLGFGAFRMHSGSRA